MLERGLRVEMTGSSIITNAFDMENWKYSVKRYDEKEKSVFNINFTFENQGTLKCVITAFDSGICDMDMTLPLSCPPEYRMMLSYYLAKTNFNKRYATYRLDVDDGEIQYSYSFEISSAIVSEEFLRIFKRTKNGAMDEEEFNEIKKCCLGKFSKEIIDIFQNTIITEKADELSEQFDHIASSPKSNKKTLGGGKHKFQF